MSAPVTTEIRDGIGLVRVDNPPVNALSQAVRAGIAGAVETLAADPAVSAIVILCAGRTFIAGADITEFGKPRQPPSLAEVCDRIEASPKPIVAALHGTALGGGLEVALACHHRIALTGAKMGLPEVKLGLIPGAGGANRLARIVGAHKALDIVVSGNPLGVPEALELGLVDEIAEADLESAALAFARRHAYTAPVATRDRQPPGANDDGFEAAAERLLAKTAGQDAPAACVASLRRALTLPFDEAIAADRDSFAALSTGPQSRALRHIFFAERAAAKLDGAPDPGRLPRSIAILGAGTMGGGIAMSFAGAGIPVTLIDTSQDAIDRGLARVRANYASSVKRGSLGEAEAEARLARIAAAPDRAAAADADLIVEAVFEDMALKREIFADLDARCRPDAILATNTSALDVDEIAGALSRPERFVGLHFFSPANVMKLVEVVEARATSPATLAAAVAVAKAIGKVPVVSGNCDGFIGNRMVAKRGAQVDRLLQQGALPQDVDAALKAFGFPMGPLAINDMSGLDIGYAIRKRRGTHFPVADAVAESGRLGQKTGRGYYRYEEGSRTPLPDPEIETLIAGVSARLGVTRRAFSQEEMIERMIFPLINEGAKILAEGIARRASDIDAVWINGYGFPRWRGGPMFHAGEAGLRHVAAQLALFAAESGDPSLAPAPLLAELAAADSDFIEWDRTRRSAAS
jgi:3-hydroxyacyl-CoA dehydrogenase